MWMTWSRPSDISAVRTTLEASLKGIERAHLPGEDEGQPDAGDGCRRGGHPWNGVSGTPARVESMRMTRAPLATIPT